MRALVFLPLLACASPSRPPAASTPSVEIGLVGPNALDVEPPPVRTTQRMPAPRGPDVGFIVDDHVGAHAVTRTRALEMAATYDDIGLLRVVGATRDEVVFDVTIGGGVAGRVRYGAALGQIAIERFPIGKMFVGAVVFDPTGARDGGANAIVEVAGEDEARAVIAEIAALRRRR